MEDIKILKIKQKNKNTSNCIVVFQMPADYEIASILKKHNFLTSTYTNVPQKNWREKTLYCFLLEGVFSMDMVLKYSLAKDMILETELLNQIIYEQQLMNAKQTAYNYASYKPRSQKQVIDKLKEEHFNIYEIRKSTDFLIEFNLINDAEFARKYIHDRLLKAKCGETKLYNSLILKYGIDAIVAKNAIEEYYPKEQIEDMAMALAQKKINSKRYQKRYAHKTRTMQRNIIYNFLIGRGFTSKQTKEVLNNIEWPKQED